jgi:hypothetical protein
MQSRNNHLRVSMLVPAMKKYRRKKDRVVKGLLMPGLKHDKER